MQNKEEDERSGEVEKSEDSCMPDLKPYKDEEGLDKEQKA
jgi:hypothetical protein